MTIRRNDIILTVLVFMVVGALLGREYPGAGSIVSVISFGIYVLAGFIRSVPTALHFKKSSRRRKVFLVLDAFVSVMFIAVLVGGGPGYFIFLAVLAADYMITNKTSGE